MLDIESYSLHIIHGAFKSGPEKNGCNRKSILKQYIQYYTKFQCEGKILHL